jgi:diguanylate cyclase (GGDEF)-like protein/PAS domain S-box-containing protein
MNIDTIAYKHILDNLCDGVYFLDINRKITYWNKGAEKISGYCARDVIGLSCSDNILVHIDQHGNQLCHSTCPAAVTLQDGQRREAEVFLRHKMGYRLPVRICVDPIFDAGGAIIGAVEHFTDISSNMALRQQVQDLEQMALFDSLTEIGNRRYAQMHLHARFNERKRYGWDFGLLFIDIDRFKLFNDTHSHAVGDRVLRMVAQTLASNIRSFDMACRWGGDEFIIILVHVDPEAIVNTADKLRALVEQSAFAENDEQIHVTVSIGATLVLDEDTPDTIVQRADALMYRSKQNGSNCVTADQNTATLQPA